jgi:hypothetical protein
MSAVCPRYIRTITVGIEAFQRDWDAATRLAGTGCVSQYSIPDVRTSSIKIYSVYSCVRGPAFARR